MKILLLLSGGHDSLEVLQRLSPKHEIVSLCISGQQAKEVIGAKEASKKYNSKLIIVKDKTFNEEVGPSWKVALRLIKFIKIVRKEVIQGNYDAVACGLIRQDLREFAWLRLAIWLLRLLCKIHRVKFLTPLIGLSFPKKVRSNCLLALYPLFWKDYFRKKKRIKWIGTVSAHLTSYHYFAMDEDKIIRHFYPYDESAPAYLFEGSFQKLSWGQANAMMEKDNRDIEWISNKPFWTLFKLAIWPLPLLPLGIIKQKITV